MFGWSQGVPVQQYINTAQMPGRPPTPVPVPIPIKSMPGMYMPSSANGGMTANRVGTSNPFSFNGILSNIKHFFSSPSPNGQQMPQIPPQLMNNPAFRQQLEQVLLTNPNLARSVLQSLGQQSMVQTGLGNQMQARLAVPNSQPMANLISQFPMSQVNSPQSRVFSQSASHRPDDLFLLTAPFKASDDALASLIEVANKEDDAKRRALLMKQLLEKVNHPSSRDSNTAPASNNIVVQKLVPPKTEAEIHAEWASAATNSIRSQALPNILQAIKQLPDTEAKRSFISLLKEESLLQEEPSRLSEITSTFLTLTSSPRPVSQSSSISKSPPPTSIQAILKAHDEAKLRASTKRPPVVSSINVATSGKSSLQNIPLKKIPDDLADRLRGLGLNPDFLPELIRTANLVTNSATTGTEHLSPLAAGSVSVTTSQNSMPSSSPSPLKMSSTAQPKTDKAMQGLRVQLQALPPDELTKVQNLIQLVVGKPHYLPRLLNEDLSPNLKRILHTVQKLKFPETIVTTTTTAATPVYTTTTTTTTTTPDPTVMTETYSSELNQILSGLTSTPDVSNTQPQMVTIQTSASKVSTQATTKPSILAQDSMKQASTMSLTKADVASDSYVPLLYWMSQNGKGNNILSSTVAPVSFNPQRVSQYQNQISSSSNQQPTLVKLYPTNFSNSNIQLPAQSTTVEPAVHQSSTFASVPYIRNLPIEILGALPPNIQSTQKPGIDIIYGGTKSATQELKPVESASIQNLQIYGLRTTPKPTFQFDVTMPPTKRPQLPLQQREFKKDEQPTIPLAALAAALEPKILSTFLQSIQKKQEVRDGPNLFKIELSQESLPSSVPLSAVFNSVHLNSSNLMPLLNRFSNSPVSARTIPSSTTAAPPSYVSLLLPSSTVSSMSFFPFSQENKNPQPTASTTTLSPNLNPVFNPRALSTVSITTDHPPRDDEGNSLHNKENDNNKGTSKHDEDKPLQNNEDSNNKKKNIDDEDKSLRNKKYNGKKQTIDNEDKSLHNKEYDNKKQLMDDEDKSLEHKKYGNKKQITEDDDKDLQYKKHDNKKKIIGDEDTPFRRNKYASNKAIKQQSSLSSSEETDDADENDSNQPRKEKKISHSEKQTTHHFRHRPSVAFSEEDRNEDFIERDLMDHEKEREASQSQTRAEWAIKHRAPTSASSEERHERLSSKHVWRPKHSKDSKTHGDRIFKHRPFSASSSENQNDDSREKNLFHNKNIIKPVQQGTSWHEKYHPSLSSSSEDRQEHFGKKSLWQKDAKDKHLQKNADWPVKPRFSSSAEDEEDKELSLKSTWKHHMDNQFSKFQKDSDWNGRHNSPPKLSSSEDKTSMGHRQLNHHQKEPKSLLSSEEEIEPEQQHKETRHHHDIHEGQKHNFFKHGDYSDATQIKTSSSDDQHIQFHKTASPNIPDRPFNDQQIQFHKTSSPNIADRPSDDQQMQFHKTSSPNIPNRPFDDQQIQFHKTSSPNIPDRPFDGQQIQFHKTSSPNIPDRPSDEQRSNWYNNQQKYTKHSQLSSTENEDMISRPTHNENPSILANSLKAGHTTDNDVRFKQPSMSQGWEPINPLNIQKPSNENTNTMTENESHRSASSTNVHPPNTESLLTRNSPERYSWKNPQRAFVFPEEIQPDKQRPNFQESPSTSSRENKQFDFEKSEMNQREKSLKHHGSGERYNSKSQTPNSENVPDLKLNTGPPEKYDWAVTPDYILSPTTQKIEENQGLHYAIPTPPPHNPRIHHGIPTPLPHDPRIQHGTPVSLLHDPRTQHETSRSNDPRNGNSQEDNMDSKPTILENHVSQQLQPPFSSSFKASDMSGETDQTQQTLQVREPPCTHKPNMEPSGRDSSEGLKGRSGSSIQVKEGGNMASSQIYQVTSPFSKDKLFKVNTPLQKGRSYIPKMTNSYSTELDKDDRIPDFSIQSQYRSPTQKFSADQTSGPKSQISSNFRNSLWGFQGITDTSSNNYGFSTQSTVFQTANSQTDQFSEVNGFLPSYPETTTIQYNLDSFKPNKSLQSNDLISIKVPGPSNKTELNDNQNANSTRKELSSMVPLGLESQDILVKTPNWPLWTTEASLTKTTQASQLQEANVSATKRVGSAIINTAYYNSNFTQPVSVFSLPTTENPDDTATYLPTEDQDNTFNSGKSSTSVFPTMSLWPTFFSSNSEKGGQNRSHTNVTNKSQEDMVITNHTDVLINSSISKSADEEIVQTINSSFIDDNDASATDLKNVAMKPPRIDVYTRIHNPHKLNHEINKTIPAIIPSLRKINIRPTSKKLPSKQQNVSLSLGKSDAEQQFNFGNWPKKQDLKPSALTSTTTTSTIRPRKIKLRWSSDKLGHRKVLNSKPVNFYNFYQPNSETE